jgi:hypothetical protein
MIAFLGRPDSEGEVMSTASEHDGCPVCRTSLAAALSEPIAERQCPRCGALLWVLALPSGRVFFVRRSGQSAAEFLALLAGPRLGLGARDIASFLRSADALDMTEFLEELEESSHGW